jgi:uncharacterized repeat protein (TIGR01451 family)
MVNAQGAIAEASSPLCAGNTIELKSSAGTIYSWAGPANFSSTVQNPTRPNATTAMTGVYSVTVGGTNSCTGSATVSVSINALPVVTAISSSSNAQNAICEGLSVNLSASGGASYLWSGPSNFSATGANPTITNTTTANAGIYSVTATGTNSCTNSATVSVAVKQCFGSIGDYVWKDTNRNGLQDSNESGVSNITVELYRSDINGNPIGSALTTQQTGATGNYLFDQLSSGDYVVKFIIPTNLKLTTQNAGNDALGSDADLTSGFSPKVTIDTKATGITKDNPTIDAGLVNKRIDLALEKSIDKKLVEVGDIVQYVIKVKNEGEITATQVTVKDLLNEGITYQGSQASRGAYDLNTRTWTIGNVGVGETVSLTITAKVTAEGVWFNTAEVCNAAEEDIDSTPCNDDDDEDDIDHECFTVPFKLCTGESVEINLPTTLKNIVWYKDGKLIPNETSNKLIVSKRGTYTYTADNAFCPNEGCCPIEVIEIDCCIPDQCVPFVIKRTK